jgi:hypothetical protein
MKAKKIDDVEMGYELKSAIETLHKKQEIMQKNGRISFSAWIKINNYLDLNRKRYKNYNQWLEEKIAELPDIKLNN